MFQKLAIIVATSLVAVASLSAGQIQLGGSTGLTTTYMTSGVGSISGGSLKNYDLNMFSSGTNGGTAPTPFTGYSNTSGVASTAGSTLVDTGNGVTFDMISQTGSDGNFWALVGANPAITIPVGVFGVQTAWTMMNNLYGVNGVNNTDVTFTFDSAADGSNAGTLQTVTVDLVNGTEIRDAVDCTSAGCNTPGFANGALTGSTSVGGVTVVTGNIYSSIYNTGSQSPYSGTSGNLVLDDQGFEFGNTYSNLYLVSIGVTDNSGAVGVSRTGVSAVTVVTASSTATPEPSSVILLLTGFGLLGLSITKRNRLQRN